MRRIIIESPYKADFREGILANVHYARECVRSRVLAGDAPIASHLLFTQRGILRDDVPDERKLGIDAGLAWLPQAQAQVFFTDRGWSGGMLAALHSRFKWLALLEHVPIEIRALYGRPVLPALLDEDMEKFLQSCIRTE